MSERRIAVTGIGMVTPLGTDAETSWRKLLAGESGIGRITRFDPSHYACQVGGEVLEPLPPPRTAIPGIEPGRLRVIDFAAAAIDEALDQSKLDRTEAGERFGIVVSSHGIRLSLSEMARELDRTGLSFQLVEDKSWSVSLPLQNGSSNDEELQRLVTMSFVQQTLTSAYGSGGPALGLATACSSGAMSILEGCQLIKYGLCDAVLVGGADSVLNEVELSTFSALGTLSSHNEDPSRASRPFDVTRSGFVISEGACFVVLEDRAFAQNRGAQVLGYVEGWGATVSAYHLTASCPDGSSQAEAMKRAINEAGQNPMALKYINAHGTGTADNDVAETRAIKRLMGSDAYDLPVSSTKGATGHLIAAAGSAEAAFCLLAMRDRLLPPTINLLTPDPACDLDYIPQRSREWYPGLCLSNSFGLCGSNVSLVFGPPTNDD